MNTVRIGVFAACFLCVAVAGAGEVIPAPEIQALDRAISRELNTGSMGSQILGDLTRLRARLAALNDGRIQAGAAQPAPEAGDPQVSLLAKLEAEAAKGGRAARRSLAFFYMYINDPEKAREQWRLMGKGSDFDVSNDIIGAYLEIALGEHNSGKASLSAALSMLEARSPLKVANPVFCTNIAAYRVYEPRVGGAFLPGDDVLLYVEVEGVEFRDSVEGGSECVLMFGLKLKDDNQNTVWAEPNFGEYAPLFNGPIRDLHAALTWKIPNNLDPGRYHLHVEAVEESTRRRGEGVTGFQVERRPTNPEKSSVSPFLDGRAGIPPGFKEMQDAFPGAPTLPVLPGGGKFEDDKFDILQRYYQGQKTE